MKRTSRTPLNDNADRRQIAAGFWQRVSGSSAVRRLDEYRLRTARFAIADLLREKPIFCSRVASRDLVDLFGTMADEAMQARIEKETRLRRTSRAGKNRIRRARAARIPDAASGSHAAVDVLVRPALPLDTWRQKTLPDR